MAPDIKEKEMNSTNQLTTMIGLALALTMFGTSQALGQLGELEGLQVGLWLLFFLLLDFFHLGNERLERICQVCRIVKIIDLFPLNKGGSFAGLTGLCPAIKDVFHRPGLLILERLCGQNQLAIEQKYE